MSRMQHENKPVLSSERKYSIIFVLPCPINTNINLWRSMLVKTREKKNDINSMVVTGELMNYMLMIHQIIVSVIHMDMRLQLTKMDL